MKTSDLKYVKEWYSEYRSLLFNNDIPDVEDCIQEMSVC